MRKIIILITVVIGIVAIGFVACNSLEKEGREKDFVLDKAAIEQVGIIHNQCLDSVYQALWKNKVKEFKNNPDGSVLRSHSDLKVAYIDLAFETMERVLNNVNCHVTDKKVMPKEKFVDISNSAIPKTVSTEAIQANLTIQQQQFYDKLMEIVNTENITLEELNKAIFTLEKQIEKEVTVQADIELLLSATSVARHSAEYWFKNLPKWAGLNAKIIAMRDMNGNEISVTNKNVLRGTADCTPEGFIGTSYYGIPAREGYLAHPSCPNLFYYIIKYDDEYYAIHLMACPDGLLFKQSTCSCVWPSEYGQGNNGGSGAGAVLGSDIGGLISGGLWGAAGASIGTGLGMIF